MYRRVGLRNLSTNALGNLCIALGIMHSLGYVHRDVSAGNVLMFNDAGLLADLESAKKTSDLTVYEVRTVCFFFFSCAKLPCLSANQGTNQFESVEVANRSYLFRGHKANRNAPLFRFNCIHDLESTWWIAFWILCHHVPVEDNEERNEQLKHATDLFPPTGTSPKGLIAFVNGGFTATIDLLPHAFRDNAQWLSDAHDLLVDRYTQAEVGSQIDGTAFNDLHLELAQIWEQAQAASAGLKYKFLPTTKRGIIQEPEDTQGAPKRFKP
jgi:serine/threonine protein kinase